MYSGKSEELLRRLRRAQIAGKTVGLFKPEFDNRYKSLRVVSHSGQEMDAHLITSASSLLIDSLGFSVVGIDEIQFIDETIDPIQVMVNRGQNVIVAGLDQTFRREPFGDVPILMALADRVDKLSAVCHSCGDEATLTQRLVNGKPASFEGPTVQVGGLESYEARCKRCYAHG
jgi:thymidine kinase